MNIEEIDKWLDNEYGCSYTRLEELHDFLIDRNMKYQDELERYKNIINTVRNCILTDISMLKTRRPEMSKEEIIMRLEATVKSLDKLKGDDK